MRVTSAGSGRRRSARWCVTTCPPADITARRSTATLVRRACPLPALWTQADVRYTGAQHDIPRYCCWRGSLDHGEPRCIAFGGLRVDDAIAEALLRVVEPRAIAAAVEAEAQAASRRDQVREALVRDLEAARYRADRAFRQYDAIDPQNRLIAAELEVRWNSALICVGEIETRIAAHGIASKTLRLAAEAGEIEGGHPLPDGPWIFSRSTLGEPAARRVVHRARLNANYPMGSHPNQQNLFSSIA
jgi:hypothetical protein